MAKFFRRPKGAKARGKADSGWRERSGRLEGPDSCKHEKLSSFTIPATQKLNKRQFDYLAFSTRRCAW